MLVLLSYNSPKLNYHTKAYYKIVLSKSNIWKTLSLPLLHWERQAIPLFQSWIHKVTETSALRVNLKFDAQKNSLFTRNKGNRMWRVDTTVSQSKFSNLLSTNQKVINMHKVGQWLLISMKTEKYLKYNISNWIFKWNFYILISRTLPLIIKPVPWPDIVQNLISSEKVY